MLDIIKSIAVKAVQESRPMALVFGKVVSIAPLKINIEQRLTVEEKHLILTRNVTNYFVDIEAYVSTDEDANLVTTHDHGFSGVGTVLSGSFDSTHKHDISGIKTIEVKNGMFVGDTVIMLQMQGGQKYLVIEKVVMPN